MPRMVPAHPIASLNDAGTVHKLRGGLEMAAAARVTLARVMFFGFTC